MSMIEPFGAWQTVNTTPGYQTPGATPATWTSCTAEFTQYRKTVLATGRIVMEAKNSGTGLWQIALPVAPKPNPAVYSAVAHNQSAGVTLYAAISYGLLFIDAATVSAGHVVTWSAHYPTP